MQPSLSRGSQEPRAASRLTGVQYPPPTDLVAAVRDRLAGRAPEPLAVLDPRWPAHLRRRADAELAGAVASGRLTPDDLVLFTSGSSGSPRAVVRSVESWRASLQPLTEVTGIGSPDVDPDVVWVPGPLSSSLFLYGAVHAAWCGLTVVRGRPDAPVVQDATAAHLVPTQLAGGLEARERGLLPRLRTVVVAGAALARSLRDRALAQELRVVEYYGAAELSFVGWRDDGGPFGEFPNVEVRLGAGGRSSGRGPGGLSGVPALHPRLRPRTAGGPRQGAGERPAAQLWVRSPYVAREYLRPEADAPWQQRDGWHTVGDLAQPSGEGWRLLGRGELAVTTGGHTVVVADVEAALRRVTGVADVVVLGVPHGSLGEAVVAVVQPTPDGDAGLRERLLRAARQLPAASRPRRWLRLDRLPVLASGKVDRSALRELAPTLPRLP